MTFVHCELHIQFFYKRLTDKGFIYGVFYIYIILGILSLFTVARHVPHENCSPELAWVEGLLKDNVNIY